MTGYALMGVIVWFAVRLGFSFLLLRIWKPLGEVAIGITTLWLLKNLADVHKGWRALRGIPKWQRK
jgi:hypothetical protein